jgi:uncharacterized membrane protein
MVEQHLGAWIWDIPWRLGEIPFLDHPFIISFNALGGLSAPLFITLAGISSFLFLENREKSARTLALRGILLVFLGYVLNLIVPNHFSSGSWYVLQIIGCGLILSSLLAKLPDKALISLAFIIIFTAVLIQAALHTPGLLTNKRMGDLDLAGGFFRLALAEGHFPIFPWLSFFITGTVAGRWVTKQQWLKLFIAGLICLFLGTALFSFHLLSDSASLWEPLARATRPSFHFYPALPPMMFILLSLVIFSVLIFTRLDLRGNKVFPDPLIFLGRCSLSLFFLHFVIFRELFSRLNLYRTFSLQDTLSLIFLTLFLFTLLSLWWEKINFKFGLEWLLRKIAP